MLHIDSRLGDNEGFAKLAEMLEIDTVKAMGLVVTFWSWTAVNYPHGTVTDRGGEFMSFLDGINSEFSGVDVFEALIRSGFVSYVYNGEHLVTNWPNIHEVDTD